MTYDLCIGSQAYPSEEIMSSIKRIETELAEIKNFQKETLQSVKETKILLTKEDEGRLNVFFEISEPLILKAFSPVSQKP